MGAAVGPEVDVSDQDRVKGRADGAGETLGPLGLPLSTKNTNVNCTIILNKLSYSLISKYLNQLCMSYQNTLLTMSTQN
jgi:hypothetical protein